MAREAVTKLLSVNVSLAKEVADRGHIIRTGIFKEPVEERIWLRRLNLDGDEQADLSVHGGLHRAVYAYPVEHYQYWQDHLGRELPWGMFGENFTVEGLLEYEVRVGDHFRIGSTEVLVTQPRIPCYKLGIKFGRADMVKRFLASRRTGFYCSVVREGEVGAGDRVELLQRDEGGITVADVVRLYAFQRDDWETLGRAVETEALPEGWREHFREQIAGRRR